MGHPKSGEFYCVKCDMPAKFEFDDEHNAQSSENEKVYDTMETTKDTHKDDAPETIEEFDNMVLRREQERRKSDLMSKKMGELLLQGWAMLEESCQECLFPYMRSKAGEIVCVGCGPVLPEKPKKEEQEERKVERPVRNNQV
eukprot:CAMPEP_0114591234 /NCGR_PEP_ID=MMETSP0125-20121206/13333_1 /TAXON_ID=485358 ORGANISM="Aristerostoma sp., Strain ATCC 50986" /NCGR_SAMPLE_ID=MMETSP0125 /ASSEMBLY_ACC=CAM_ASM_000245 /LENGTH=141 /DNA_ID=CAMNT_0001789219 /DNA_START=148 /DNA_END=573 /DNA_ORIENTATION=+